MRVRLRETQREVQLQMPPLATGGQGQVYQVVGDADLLIKVWHQHYRTSDATARVEALLQWPFRPPQVALPTAIVQDCASGATIGFAMWRFPGAILLCAYDPVARKRAGLHLETLDLLATAAALAGLVHSIHQSHLLIGDLHESNFLVQAAGLTRPVQVFGMDADSYEFAGRNAQGTYCRFRCGVGKEPYLAPELQGKNLARINRTIHTDHFALAVLIAQLLQGGSHPFNFKDPDAACQPSLGDRIACGQWPQAPHTPLPANAQAVDAGIPWQALPPPIQRLFHRAFHEGHPDPTARPSAEEWHTALRSWERGQRGWSRLVRGSGLLQRLTVSMRIHHTWAAGMAWLSVLPMSSALAALATATWARWLLLVFVLAVLGYLAVPQASPRRGGSPLVEVSRLLPQEPQRDAQADQDRWRSAPRLWREALRENK